VENPTMMAVKVLPSIGKKDIAHFNDLFALI
jgi:hypothetical protein